MARESELDSILSKYQKSFVKKSYTDENNESDILMEVFGITPEMKRENRQYWGRELGKCWELLVTEVCRTADSFEGPLKVGKDEPCDLRIGNYAIDTKYRVGSGDSGTLKKFKQYGPLLQEHGYQPVFLFLREDNLPAAVTACRKGGWEIHMGKASFDFIQELSGFDLEGFLLERAGVFPVLR